VEDLLHERGIDICHETVRFWWNRFGPLFAADIRKKRMRAGNFSRWHVDEVFVKINGELHYHWRAVDHEGEVLEFFDSKTVPLDQEHLQQAPLSVLRCRSNVAKHLHFGIVNGVETSRDETSSSSRLSSAALLASRTTSIAA
jgi:DDE domain